MKLTGKLPHELCRDDVLRAAHYEGDTIANQLSQAFVRYKVEQYSWAHIQSEVGEESVQSLMPKYRQERCPPWVMLRRNLDRMLRCHYNFLRPHRALKFGREVRTPAMQAGLTKKRLTFRDVFTSISNFLCLVRTVCVLIVHANPTKREDLVTSMAA